MRKKTSDVQTERERNIAEWKLDPATKRAHQEQSMISVTPEHLHQWVCIIQNNKLERRDLDIHSTEIHKQYLYLRDKPQQLQSLIFICRTVIPHSPLAIFYPCKALYCSWKDHWSIVNPHQNSFSKALQTINPVISSQTLSNPLLQAHIRGHVSCHHQSSCSIMELSFTSKYQALSAPRSFHHIFQVCIQSLQHLQICTWSKLGIEVLISSVVRISHKSKHWLNQKLKLGY